MRVLLVVAVLVMGCGGWDPALSGTWAGSSVITAGQPGAEKAITLSSKLVLSVSGGFGVATEVCPDGRGRIDFQGGGTSGTWTGLLSCPIPTKECPTGSFVFRSATLELRPAGPTLLASMRGDLNYCTSNGSLAMVPAKVEFSGSKG